MNNKTRKREKIDPFKLTIQGSIPNSIARALSAICYLIEEAVEYLTYRMRKSRK
jgi:hypothetical protein